MGLTLHPNCAFAEKTRETLIFPGDGRQVEVLPICLVKEGGTNSRVRSSFAVTPGAPVNSLLMPCSVMQGIWLLIDVLVHRITSLRGEKRPNAPDLAWLPC